MTRDELITTIEKVRQLYLAKNKRKARLLFGTIKAADFGALRFAMSHGIFADGKSWIFYVDHDWDDRLYCKLFLDDALQALRSEPQSEAA